MTQPTSDPVARRWQAVALMAIMLLIGYIAGGFATKATAQQTVTKVQLDTTNCRTYLTGTPVSRLENVLSSIPRGHIYVETATTSNGYVGVFYGCN